MELGKVDDVNDQDVVRIPVQQQLIDGILIVLGPGVLASCQGLVVHPVELLQHPFSSQGAEEVQKMQLCLQLPSCFIFRYRASFISRLKAVGK